MLADVAVAQRHRKRLLVGPRNRWHKGEMLTPLVIDARGAGLGHRTRGIGRVIVELLGALDELRAPVRVVGPKELSLMCPHLPLTVAAATAYKGVLSPGPFADASHVLRLAPVAPSEVDVRSSALVYDLIPLKAPHAHFGGRMPWRLAPSWHVYRSAVRTWQRVGHIVVTTQPVVDDCRRMLGCSHHRFDVVHLAPTGRGVPTDSAASALIAQMELPSQYCLWVLGGINANKNVDGMLRASAAGMVLPLVVVGNVGAADGVLAKRARALGAPVPTVLGHVSDDALRCLYRAATCLVLPSLDEGFGLPLVEARALGTRVVANDIPVLREIADDGVILCDVGDPAAFSAACDSTRLKARLPPATVRCWQDVASDVLRAIGEHRAQSALRSNSTWRAPS